MTAQRSRAIFRRLNNSSSSLESSVPTMLRHKKSTSESSMHILPGRQRKPMRSKTVNSDRSAYLTDETRTIDSDAGPLSSSYSFYDQTYTLINSEILYMRTLEIIRDRIAEPLQRRCAPRRGLLGFTRAATPPVNAEVRDVLGSLFDLVPLLLRVHQSFLQDLKALDTKSFQLQHIVWVFRMNLNEFQNYVQVLQQQVKALIDMENLCHSDATFALVFHASRSEHECMAEIGDISIYELFSKPAERIWHYISFMESALARFLVLDCEKESNAVCRCLEQLEQLDMKLAPIREQIRQVERLATIQNSIVHMPTSFLSASQRLVRESPFFGYGVGNRAAPMTLTSPRDVPTHSVEAQDVQVWLFHDRLVVGEDIGFGRYLHRATVYLVEAAVLDRDGGIVLRTRDATVFSAWKHTLHTRFTQLLEDGNASCPTPYVEVDELPVW
ncbi:hypothetical protein THASP1DRAFT_31111 [Thamnocephalis sphaerospora]|uniref:DH domain-containing protein n=1 Tax=Thamnocephalis sphaerospora TaxID=78915 RepID=A0A4P9XMD8_9FUNG|nr:hypothetical protein THASP1DRAFT_31111 [Thamnocephalis sphaerospora]|eukprot:RKP07073.1 hypothetical protein THASP1DRAFT_31111 [Thamnocephalis sphaerospora]